MWHTYHAPLTLPLHHSSSAPLRQGLQHKHGLTVPINIQILAPQIAIASVTMTRIISGLKSPGAAQRPEVQDQWPHRVGIQLQLQN